MTDSQTTRAKLAAVFKMPLRKRGAAMLDDKRRSQQLREKKLK